MRNIFLVTGSYLIAACGSGDEISAPTQCSVDLAFAGVEVGEVSDVVKFEAAPTNECLVMMRQRNGGVSWSVEERGEKVLGRIKAVYLGEGRTVELDAQGTEGDISGGSAFVKRSYFVGDLSNVSTKDWLLPWVDPPTAMKVSVALASSTGPESYPKQIKVKLETQEKATEKAETKTAAEAEKK